MPRPSAIFVLNLLQDVNIVRPLVFIAARDLGLDTCLLVSRKFVFSDSNGKWLRELEELTWQMPVRLCYFGTIGEALQVLGDKHGVLIAASESCLPPHAETHGLFRAAPPGFTRITLQHGFEGVGFLHSREHDRVHGKDVNFAAEILCGWFDAAGQTSMLASQRPKLIVTGPTTALCQSPAPAEDEVRETGLVCENLHSVRFTANAGSAGDFVQCFRDFCASQETGERRVGLRPHPAGQYVVKHKVALPANAVLVNDPIYKVALGRFAYGISAPSSVLIDMMLAGIPVAVWRDEGGAIDSDAYAGLATVTTTEDWVAFARDAIERPEPFLETQWAFLERHRIPTDAVEVGRRFTRVIKAAAEISLAPPEALRADERVVLVTDSGNTELARVFRDAIDEFSPPGRISVHLLSMAEALRALGANASGIAVEAWVNARLEQVRPTAIVFQGSATPFQDVLIGDALRRSIAIVQFVGCTVAAAGAKSKVATAPETLERLFDAADLVCGSPSNLAGLRDKIDAVDKPTVELSNWDGLDVHAVSRSGWSPKTDRVQQVRAMFARLKRLPRRRRVLLVCPGYMPTLQLSFIKPFAIPAARREVVHDLITAEQIAALGKDKVWRGQERRWIAQRFRTFAPDILVLCRYGGPHQDLFLGLARQAGIPTVYHIDDDLLNVPMVLGEKKAAIHNAPARVGAVRQGLDESDLVYCSTRRLKAQLEGFGVRAPIRAGQIYCPGRIIAPAELRPVRRFGYMASADHAHNLALMLPGLIAFLRRNEDIEFELFGSIPRPQELAEFGKRVRGAKPISNYDDFLTGFAQRKWDVGVCPLAPIDFNLAKADTKLIEYTSIGAAVVASRGTAYDHFGTDGSCLLAGDEDEWQTALETLIDPQRRYEQVLRAQARIAAHYTIEGLYGQVIGIFDDATERFRSGGAKEMPAVSRSAAE